MAAITLLISFEKTTTVGRRVDRVMAGALITYGILVVMVPGVLPTTM
jgi:predicted metal-binding membrane protein